MVHSAQFIRKPTREELQPQRVIIEKVITLDAEAFHAFMDDPLEDRDYIKANANLMYEEPNGIVHCILIRSDEYAHGYLINSEGYAYARYAAIFTDPEVAAK